MNDVVLNLEKDFCGETVPNTHKRHLSVTSKKLINCIQTQKIILDFLLIIKYKRQIIRYGLKRLGDQALHAPIAILFSQTTFSMLTTSI